MDAASPQSARLNLTNPRVIRSIRRALKWCELNLSFDRSREAWSSDIQGAFGPSSAGRIGAYLRQRLLIKTQNYRVTDHAKGQTGYPSEYRLNEEGYKELLAVVGGDLGSDYTDVYPEVREELEKLEFVYKDKSDRYWHDLQNMKREAKPKFWRTHGLPFDYDIAACAPTILLQMAKNKGLNRMLGTTVERYLADRNGFRSHVAAITGLSFNEAKGLINSFFNGASLALTPWCTAYAEHGHRVVEALQNDREVRMLRSSIKSLWIYIRRGEKVERKAMGMSIMVPERLNVRTAKNKWAIYFSQERKVLDTIIDYLRANGIKHFTEHDGFRTNKKIDVAALEHEILTRTGFALTIEENA